MIKAKRLICIILSILILLPGFVAAITEVDNGTYKIYTTSGGLEFSGLKGFDIKGYIEKEDTLEKTLISSTFSDDGYHTFLNVNGINGEMTGLLTDEPGGRTRQEKAIAMQYTALEGEGTQNINGVDLKVSTSFGNDGQTVKITYTLKNTTSQETTISLATISDVQIDNDDSATIERIADGSVRLWTERGNTKQPVQFVFYGKGMTGVTDIDNLWIGNWSHSYYQNMFNTNPETNKIENRDSAFCFSWENRTIAAGQTQTYSVQMEVGQIYRPNISELDLDNNKKFYVEDIKINGTVTNKNLIDEITIHYVLDGGAVQKLPPISMTGNSVDFQIDLSSLGLAAVTPHTIKVWSIGSTGLKSNEVERTFVVTNLKDPVLTISETEWTTNDVTFTITDTENLSQYVDKYQYKINDGSWTDVTKGTVTPITGEGISAVSARILGTTAGDISNIVTGTAKIDKTPPTDTIPTATSTTNSITVTFKQTDNESGINNTETKYAMKTGETWGEWQTSNVFSELIHNANYIVKTTATDNVGHITESQELEISTKELIPGTLILKLNNSQGATYEPNTWTNQNVFVTVTGTTGTTYKSIEPSAQEVLFTSEDREITADGITTLETTTTDGTNTVQGESYAIKVDKTPPIINEMTLDEEDWISEGSKTLTAKATDNLSGISYYQFSIDSDLIASSSGWESVESTTQQITQTKEITDESIYYFYVKDEAGNVTKASIQTKIDKTGPTISFNRANGQTAISAIDNESGLKEIKYYWSTENTEPSDGDWIAYDQAVKYTGQSNGTIYLWARAVDHVGNSSALSTTYKSAVAPQIDGKTEFVDENASFKLLAGSNADSDIIYQYKINDGEWQSISKDTAKKITDIKSGNIKITARTLDNAGRYSEEVTKTLKVTIKNSKDTNDENNNKNNTSNDKKKKDDTVAPGILPKTGKYIMYGGIILACVFAVVSFKKYKSIILK